MTKYRFTPAERYAVYSTHSDRCYLGGEPIDMVTFQVDHIIPEQLLSAPSRLAEALKLLGRDPGFQVNSFENWLPACANCNAKKRSAVFQPSPIVQLHLQIAAEKADAARSACQKVVTSQVLSRAANTLQRAAADGDLPEHVKAALWPLLKDYAGNRSDLSGSDVVRVSPTYVVPLLQLLSDDGHIAVAKGPYGIGGGPSLEAPVSPAMRCPSCGGSFFNGTRCVACGAQDDGD